MEIDIETFKTYVPETMRTSDGRYIEFLRDAKRKVIRDGVKETHDDFDVLQRLYALFLIQQFWNVRSKSLSTKSVSSYAGVTVFFDGYKLLDGTSPLDPFFALNTVLQPTNENTRVINSINLGGLSVSYGNSNPNQTVYNAATPTSSSESTTDASSITFNRIDYLSNYYNELKIVLLKINRMSWRVV